MNKEIVEYLKKKWILPVCVVGFLAVSIYLLGFWEKSPIPKFPQKIKQVKDLKNDITKSEADLQKILEDNKAKEEAAKSATQKEFYKSDSGDLSPILENVTTFIKQDGLRLKSININQSPNDNLIKNGMGAYKGNQVDFELVGYYPQYVALLNDLNTYQYFLAISKFDIKPYQYDKRILISKLSVTLYSKR